MTVFDGRYKGKPVYLDLDETVLADIAEQLDPQPQDPAADLVLSVRQVLALDQRHWLQPAIERVQVWRKIGRSTPPPCLSVLAVLVLAAERMRSDGTMSGRNYYGRLCVDVLGLPESRRRDIAAGYRRDAADLFQCLNAWLALAEGARGFPTAVEGGATNRFVQLAISQAMLREGDRERLVNFFDFYGLPAGTSVADADIARLLKDYASRASGTLGQNLNDLIGRGGEPLQRLSSLVSEELESWDGTTSERNGRCDPADRLRLRVAASIGGFPRPSLRLALLVGGSTQHGSWTTDPETQQALGQRGPGTVSWLIADWRILQTEEQPAWQSILARHLQITVDGVTVRREPRRVIALRQEPSLSRWVESERLAAGEDALVLAVEDLAAEVEHALGDCARPGWREVSDLPGLPVGWRAFAHVQIMAPPASRLRDLAALVPSSHASLTLGGGLRLPGQPRRWHRLDPPEIRLSMADRDRVFVRIEQSRRLDDMETAKPIDLGQHPGITAIPVHNLNLDPGDFLVRICSSEPPTQADLMTATMRLRDGDHLAVNRISAEPLDLGHDARTPLSGISAVRVRGEALRGAAASLRMMDDAPNPDAVELPGIPSWVVARRLPSDADLVPNQVVNDAPPCFTTGAHYFELPPARRRAGGQLIEGHCKYCGKRDFWPSRPVKDGQWRTRRQEFIEQLTSSRAVTDLREGDRQKVHPDVVLDALTHLRDGSFAELETVLRADLDTLEAAVLRRNLEALGHLEIERDDALEPTAWRVAPPTLALLPKQGSGVEAVLAGARSRALVQRLRDAISSSHADIVEQLQPGLGPLRIGVRASSSEELREVAERVRSDGLPLCVSVDAAASAASLMRPIAEIAEQLPQRAPPYRAGLRRLALRELRWVATERMDTPGVYRVDLGFRTYQCLRTQHDIAGGVMRVGPHEVIKHAAVRTFKRSPLIAYAKDREELIAPSLVGLPGLLERAAVLCSGLVAEERTNGQRIYRRVPPYIARCIALRLTE